MKREAEAEARGTHKGKLAAFAVARANDSNHGCGPTSIVALSASRAVGKRWDELYHKWGYAQNEVSGECPLAPQPAIDPRIVKVCLFCSCRPCASPLVRFLVV